MIRKIISFFVFLAIISFPSRPVWGAVFPSDAYYRNQWYLDKIKAPEAWGLVSGSPNITVAVIDSGVQITHPDLKDNLWVNRGETPGNNIDDDHNGFIDDVNGWDFINNNFDPNPKFVEPYTEAGLTHGTMVAGILGATGNNEAGIAGVSWRVKIMALKALNEKGEGRMSDVIRALDYAVNNGADIINLSFVSFSYSESLKEAIVRAYRAGVIVVAAAGNDHTNGNNGNNLNKNPMYPACYAGDNGENLVIGVAATDALDQKAVFSSYGQNCVDISAPGISFFSTTPYNAGFVDGRFSTYYNGYWSGTSMATPLVTGALALIKESNPNISRDDILRVLLKSADNIDANNPDYVGQLGLGRLNLSSAINWSLEKLNDYSGKLLISPYFNSPQDRLYKFDEHLNRVTVAQIDGLTELDFQISNQKVKEGINMTSGDVDGDGSREIVIANSFNGQPIVRVFSAKGKLKKEFLAYDKKFLGGVNVASGDIDGDSKDEILVAPASNSQPLVKIFDNQGKLKKQFLAYDKKFLGGVNVASGDVNSDGFSEIVTSPGFGGGPHVKVFDKNGAVKNQFMAYGASFRGGVKVAVANLDGRFDRNKAEIIVAPQSGAEPYVKVFNNLGQLRKMFLAYGLKFQNGFSIAAGDVNNDGQGEIITGAAAGGAPHVRVFDNKGALLESFYVGTESFTRGVNVGFILVNN